MSERESGRRSWVREHGLGLALFVSLLLHAATFAAIPLGAVRDRGAGAPIELQIADGPARSRTSPAATPAAPIPATTRRRPRPAPERRVVVRPPARPPAPRPEPLKLSRPAGDLIVKRLPPPPRQQLIQQRNAEKQEKPENARYLARDNRRVEEETVARSRRVDGEDVETNPGRGRTEAGPEPGNSEDQEEAANDRARGGADERTRGRAQAQGTTLAVRVPDGSNAPPRPALAGLAAAASSEGTLPVPGPSDPGSRGHKGRPLKLRLSWGQFEQIYGEDNVSAQAEIAQKLRASRWRGSSHQAQWARIRAAIENHVLGVRVGNQTALNAAASPFAEYVNAMHNRIHPIFSDGFLAGLSDRPWGSPLRNPELFAILEIAIDPDGSVGDLGIVNFSGVLPFDVAAIDAVLRAAPYGRTPDAIRSGDGRAYLHWGFYANNRQCGTFNAEPYILPDPPRNRLRDPGPQPLKQGARARPPRDRSS